MRIKTDDFTFRPVGQGLFYTGSLMRGTYNFVYDCGTSNKQRYVEKEIDGYIKSLNAGKDEQPIIDFVVISHLHKDHFSGLYYLLNQSRVKKIYLPYLGNDQTVIRATLALAIFGDMEENEGQENGMIFSFMCGLYGLEEGGEFRRYSEIVVFTNEEEISFYDKSNDVVYLTESFTVGLNGNPYWQFSLIESRVSAKKLIELRERLEEIEAVSTFCFGDILYSKAFLDKLKAVYESVFGKGNALNLTSILLVHFPLYNDARAYYPNENIYEYWDRHDYPYFFYNEMFYHKWRTATLLTGDAMIDSFMAREINKALKERELLVLQAPHHGSKENWKTVKGNKLTADTYIIPFGYGNRHNHPSVETIDDLTARNEKFYCVTQKEDFKYYID